MFHLTCLPSRFRFQAACVERILPSYSIVRPQINHNCRCRLAVDIRPSARLGESLSFILLVGRRSYKCLAFPRSRHFACTARSQTPYPISVNKTISGLSLSSSMKTISRHSFLLLHSPDLHPPTSSGDGTRLFSHLKEGSLSLQFSGHDHLDSYDTRPSVLLLELGARMHTRK